jgi:septal ring factor EnvC (AmiA/AmiB activator)
VQREVSKLKEALEEAKQQNKELQGLLTQRTQQSLLEDQQKQEIAHARSRFAAKRQRARQEKARATDTQSSAQKGMTDGGQETPRPIKNTVCPCCVLTQHMLACLKPTWPLYKNTYTGIC